MYSNSESGLNRPSNSVRRIQSMPQQPATPPPQYSLRRVATAIPVLGTYPNMHQPVHFQPVISYPFANYNPSHEVYHDPNVRAQSDHSPIDQQREELERYRQNRQSSNNYSTTVLDTEARQLEEAIALSLMESTRHVNRSSSVSVSSNDHSRRTERDTADHPLLATTHMTPAELADEKALQEAILISIRDTALEQEHILSCIDRKKTPERSGSTHRAHHHNHEEHTNDHYSTTAAPPQHSASAHRARHRHHDGHEHTTDYHPAGHRDVSREQPHHSSYRVHHNHHHNDIHHHQMQKADHSTMNHRDLYNSDVYAGADNQLPLYPTQFVKDVKAERQHRQSLLYHTSQCPSENSSVVTDHSQDFAVRPPPPVFGHATLRAPPPLPASGHHLQNVSANSSVVGDNYQAAGVSTMHAPPPVFGQAILRAPPPLMMSYGRSQNSSANNSVGETGDYNSKLSGHSDAPAMHAPPPVFGHATLRAPPPHVPAEQVHNGVRHQ